MKIRIRNLGLIFALVMLFIGIVGVANAQESLPKGGDSFETAVKLELGSYKGRSLESHEVEYFYIADVKPGQEIKVKGTFTPETKLSAIAIVDLYDENRTDLGVGCYESGEGTMDIPCEVSWMTNSDRETYKYYIRTGSDTWNITSYLLDISLIDRYDAGSQTDAGDTVEKAMSINSGEYKGYLSGELGIDAKDFYKVTVKKGETLTVKVTPPSEARMKVVVYDSNRKVLKDEYAQNPGAIVTNSVPIAKSGDAFVAVICDEYCSKELVAYTLNIEAEEGVAVEEEILPEEEVSVEEMYPGIYPKEAEEAVEVVKKGFGWALIMGIVGIVVVLVIIGLVVYFLTRKKKK